MCNKWDKRENSAFTVRCANINITSSGLSYSRRMYFDELLDNLHFHRQFFSFSITNYDM